MAAPGCGESWHGDPRGLTAGRRLGSGRQAPTGPFSPQSLPWGSGSQMPEGRRQGGPPAQAPLDTAGARGLWDQGSGDSWSEWAWGPRPPPHEP